MDPITLAIITGIASGAATKAIEGSTTLSVEAYTRLKTKIIEKFGKESDLVDAIEKVEQKLDSEGRRATLQEEVQAVKAQQDADVLASAQKLIEALESTPEGKQAIRKYQIDAKNAQIGVIGDNTKIEDGLNIGEPKK